jgi:hypothetical protein
MGAAHQVEMDQSGKPAARGSPLSVTGAYRLGDARKTTVFLIMAYR